MTATAPHPELLELPEAMRREVFLPYQKAWILDQARIAVFEKSRRIGADWTEAFRAVRDRISGARSNDYWYSSADESAAREFMLYVQMWLTELYGGVFEILEEDKLFDDDKVRVFTIEAPEVNGARPRITAMTSSPRTFRSKGGDVTLSELAHHDDPVGMWKSAWPCTTWGGQLRVISTHNGEGSILDKLVQMALRHEDPATHGTPKPNDVRSSLHRVTIDDAIRDGLCERINEVTGDDLSREAFREELRRGCLTEENWQEEYLCVPSKSRGSYFPYDLISPCVSDRDARERESVTDFLADVELHAKDATAIWVGADIGRVRDLFVLWALAEFPGVKTTAGLLAFTGRPFREMAAALDMTMRLRLPGGTRVVRACVDATGIGMHLAEELAAKHPGRVEEVTYTAALKTEIFTRLHASFEDRSVSIPDDDIVHLDLHSVRKSVTASGAVRFDAAQGDHGHADRANALALAVHAAAAPRPAMGFAKMPRGAWA